MITTAIPEVPQHLFYEHGQMSVLSSDLTEEIKTLALPYGKADVKHWQWDDIAIHYTKHYFDDYFFFEKKNNDNKVCLEFNMKGSYLIRHAGQVYNVKGAQHNIIYTPQVHNTFQNGDLIGETFKIHFSPERFLSIAEDGNDILKRFADRMMEGNPVVLSPNSQSITPELKKAIQDILHCRYTGGLKKLFMLSKSIEILVLQAESYDKAEQKSHQTIYCKGPREQDQIHYARTYMEQHMDTPPSLSELARIVGLNEYKLKRGFKEIYQTTIFGYLADHRLLQARQLLLDTAKTASEIAYELGYSSPQHFNNAFRKKFGITPQKLRNK
ncbi:helix-turn-helix transcriptional regulator [Xanthocytophaga flava]|uniref:helix-turn-helix transcriptional regulator n=1 Tax=Xanthocytophaga flava TaxID=3048013 RepID=UPI0028D4A7DE|nr:AraC family transcriptional regulator [Xanthocytophaga flavus]MDJ1469961.1 AraC family transcriptional regulator [Xanthocytophaga flavus]